MSRAEQVELVDAHPRLGAPPSELSAASFGEQGYATQVSSAWDPAGRPERERIAAELGRLNDAYEARFGFRYCVFVAGRSRAELLPGFEAALTAEPADELRRALTDVIRIAEDRYRTANAEGSR
jgi:2-oxo-4-hydroxy-4-carboxy--5-ureidoimidazoline (OHCU) decarboxylase